jgi:hypothetical protein
LLAALSIRVVRPGFLLFQNNMVVATQIAVIFGKKSGPSATSMTDTSMVLRRY